MSEIFFIIKSLILTVIVVFMLQIRLGTKTVEGHIEELAENSRLVTPAQKTADSIVALIGNGMVWVKHQVSEQGGRAWNSSKETFSEMTSGFVGTTTSKSANKSPDYETSPDPD